MNNNQYELFQANWVFTNGESTTDQIDKLCIGSVLNLCSGKSKLGYSVDIDDSMKPDMLADIFNLPFKQRSFDTVIIDPPYSYFNRFKWLKAIAYTARKRVILSAGQIYVRLPNFKLVDIIAVIPLPFVFVRLWYIYDKINEELCMTI